MVEWRVALASVISLICRTLLCLGTQPALAQRSLLAQGTIQNAGSNPASGTCKASNLPAVLPLGPLSGPIVNSEVDFN